MKGERINLKSMNEVLPLMSGKRQIWPPRDRRCDGSSSCQAVRHTHGCFSDNGNCDEPSEHGS